MSITSKYTAPITTKYTKPITTKYTAPITTKYTAPITTKYTQPVTKQATQSIVSSINQRLASQAAASAAARVATSNSGKSYAPNSGKSYAPNYFSDYNDPYALNSAADVLFNREAKSRALSKIGMGKEFFKKYPGLADVASIIPASLDLLWQQSIKPIVGLTKYGYENSDNKIKGALEGAGKGLAASGFNALNNVLETLDIPANVVKGGMIQGTDYLKEATGKDNVLDIVKDKVGKALTGKWTAEDGAQMAMYNAIAAKGAATGTGLTSAGRPNFDYNTGNVAKDMALEFISDPLNILSLGAAGAAKGGVKAATKTILKEASQELGSKATKKLVKAVTREYLQSASKEALEDITTRVLKQKSINKLAQQALRTGSNATKAEAKKLASGVADDLYRRTADEILNKISKDSGIKIAKKIYSTSEGVQSALLKATLGTTPLGASAYTLKGAKYIGNLLSNKLLKPVDNDTVNIFKNLDKIISTEFNKATTVKPEAPVVEAVKPIKETNTALQKDFIDIARNNFDKHTDTLSALLPKVQDITTTNNRQCIAALPTAFQNYIKALDTLCDDPIVKTARNVDDNVEIAAQLGRLKETLSFIAADKPIEEFTTKELFERLSDISTRFNKNISDWENVYDLDRASLQYLLDAAPKEYSKLVSQLPADRAALARSVKQDQRMLRYVAESMEDLDDINASIRNTLYNTSDRLMKAKVNKILNEADNNPTLKAAIQPNNSAKLINDGYAKSVENVRKAMDIAIKQVNDVAYNNKAVKDYGLEVFDKTNRDLCNKVYGILNHYINKGDFNTFRIVGNNTSDKMVGFHGDNMLAARFSEMLNDMYNSLDKMNTLLRDKSKLKTDAAKLARAAELKGCMLETFDHIKTYYTAMDRFLDKPNPNIEIGNAALEVLAAIKRVGIDALNVSTDIPAKAISDEEIVYVIKASQSLNNLRLMNIPSVVEFVNEVLNSNSYLGRMLDTIAKSGTAVDAVNTLRRKAAAFVEYRKLTDTLLNMSGVPTDAVVGVLDSIATKSNMDPKLFNMYRKYFISDIINKAELNYGQRFIRNSSKLEDQFLKHGGVPFGQAHTACYDSQMTGYLDKTLNIIPTDNKTIKVYYDLETLGLKDGTGDIVQIGVHCPELGINKDINIRTNKVPPDSLLTKLNTNRAEFEAKFCVDGLPSEKEGITEFFDTLENIRTTQGKEVCIAGYNNHDFDDWLLTARSRTLGVDPGSLESFKQLRSYDVLNYIKKNNDIFTFDERTRKQITELLDNYIDTALTKDFDRVAQSIDNDFAKAIKEVTQNVDTRKYKGAPVKESFVDKSYLQSISNDIYAVLNDISQTNVDLSKAVILSSDLPDNTNIMNILTKDIQGVAHFAAKKVADMPAIDTFFDISDDMRRLTPGNVNGKQSTSLRNLTRLSYSLQRRLNSIKNPTLYADCDFETALRTIKQFAEQHGMQIPARYIRVHPNNVDYNFIATAYAYRSVLNKAAKITQTLVYSHRAIGVVKLSEKLDTALFKSLSSADYRKFKELFDTPYGGDIFKRPLTEATSNTDLLSSVFKRTPEGTQLDDEAVEQILRGSSFFDEPEYLKEFLITNEDIRTAIKELKNRDLVYDKILEDKNLIATASQKHKAIADKLHEIWEGYSKLLPKLKGITDPDNPKYMKELKQVFYTSSEDFTLKHLDRIFNYTPEEFAAHLYHDCAGRLTTTTKDLLNKDFIEGLEKQHIHVVQNITEKGKVRSFFVADKNYTDYFKSLSPVKAAEYCKTYNPNALPIVDYLEAFRAEVDKMIPIGDNVGDLFTATTVKNLDTKVPDELQQYLIPVDKFVKDGFFETKRYNQTNIGSVLERREIDDHVAFNPMKPYLTTYRNSMAAFDNKTLYTGMFFNKDMNINTSPLFKDLSDDDLLSLLKDHKEYTCVTLAQDRHCTMGYKIAKINALNINSVKQARKMSAIIIPTNQYLKLFNVINDFKYGSKVLKAINGFVTSTYKMGYLSTLGMVARNLMDGYIKGTIQLNSPLELPKVVSHWFTSCKLLNDYNSTYKQLVKYLDDIGRIRLDSNVVDTFFELEYKGSMSKDLFNTIHEFISEGPSAGMTGEMEKYFKNLSKTVASSNTSEAPALDKAIYAYQKTIRTVFFPSLFVNNINGAVEQTLRLDQYLTMVENGYTKNKAMQKVIATQFNYDAKPLMQHYVETFLPFTGFTLANFEFYCDQIAKKGWVGSTIRDIMTPAFDLDSLSDPAMYDYDGRVRTSVFDDIAKARENPSDFDWGALLTPNEGTLYISQGMLYHILNGNIRWNTGVTDMNDERKELYKVLKLNPSFMDAFQFLNNPVDSLYGRLLPIISNANEIINNDPEQYPYKTTNAVLLDSLPLIGTTLQRFNAVYKNYKNTKDPAYILSSVFGTSSQFKKIDPKKFATASKALKNLWYAQYKTNKYKEEYNPYPYVFKNYKKSKKVYKNPIEKWLAYQFYLFKKNNLPEKYNPYVLYNGLRNPEDQFVKEPFNPKKINPLAGRRQVAYWYKLYKENHLSEEFNPYLYYPQYSKSKLNYKPFDPKNIDKNATAKQVAYWYAMYKTKGLADEFNPYLYYPQYSKYKPFDPKHLDPNVTEKQVAYWYAMYKTKGLSEEYNPYIYYPQFAKQTKLFDPAHDFDPNATEKQVKAWYAKFKESGLPELFNPYNYYPQFSLSKNTKLFDPAHDFDPKATSAQVAAWYAKFKESGLPDLFNPYKYYPQYSKGKGPTKLSILNPMKLSKHPTEKDVNAWYAAYKALGLSERYNPYNYYPQFKAKPEKIDLMHLPKNPTTKQVAAWYAWYKANGKDQKYNPYNYYPKLSSKSGSSSKRTGSFSSKGATSSIKSNPTYKNYTRMYSAAAYTNKTTRGYSKAYNYTANFYNKLYSSKGTSRIKLRLDTYNDAKSLFHNISSIRYMFKRRWTYFDNVM